MPAIFFRRQAPNPKELVGAKVANLEFLNALIDDEGFKELHCYAPESRDVEEFRGLVESRRPGRRQVTGVLYGDHAGLSGAGVLHRPDPHLANYLWQRRHVDQRSYSVTGIIHSISSVASMEGIGNLMVAPMQPWDALICTSRSGQQAVRTILDNWAEYLAERFDARPRMKINLPVIPLGIDCAGFSGGAAPDLRSRIRAELQIGERDVAVLFVGRLTFRRKAHPVPMYIALERAQQATKARVHFIQAGKFEDEKEEEAFQRAAAEFCPSVRTLVVGGQEIFRDRGIWSAADIFLSLSDNIQETFGLAPVEAMAAGIPVVASDWDGYRDTVRDATDGFLIPTTLPPAASGIDLAKRYLEIGSFRHYYGTVAMSTAVDLEACTAALVRLIRDPALRRQMGRNGRERARAKFDWPIVLKEYRRLWEALAETRKSAEPIGSSGVRSPYPLCDDPFRVFKGNATRIIDTGTTFSLAGSADGKGLEQLRAMMMTRFGSEWRVDYKTANGILERIGARGAMTMAELRKSTKASDAHLQRTITYLLKFGLLRIA